VFARLAAERLGLAPDDVQVVQGDSDFALGGSAAVASRGTATAGSAVVEVAAEVLRKGQALAAQRLEAAEADLVFADGAYCVAGTDRKVTLLALAEDGALDSQGMTRTAETYPNGCHIAEVEIDRDTGLVTLVAYTATDDCGVVLDHHLADAQVMGGAAQGIGQALFERIAYDSEGQLLSASFMDYALPRAADLPGFACHSAPTPCRTNALGVKGVGEAGATAAPAAIMNAIADALPAGAALQLPATAEAVWRALQAGGGLGD
jgi:carbon-monoxide dehydrogenase large subunit